jgi:hypothetical protein
MEVFIMEISMEPGIDSIDNLAMALDEFACMGDLSDMIREELPKMDEYARGFLWTALFYNVNANRQKYYLEKFGIEILSHGNYELDQLDKKDIVAANKEIYALNKPFYDAMDIIRDYSHQH